MVNPPGVGLATHTGRRHDDVIVSGSDQTSSWASFPNMPMIQLCNETLPNTHAAALLPRPISYAMSIMSGSAPPNPP